MVLSGHQPNYWPYPGLIGKIMLSDSFVYVTKVQFEKKSWQKRNRIRTKEGWNYIQVPTITKGKFDQNICEVEIDNNTDWREKTLKTIQLLYGKAPYFKEYYDFLVDLYGKEWKWTASIIMPRLAIIQVATGESIPPDSRDRPLPLVPSGSPPNPAILSW